MSKCTFNQVMRQEGDGQAGFRNLLQAFRDGKVDQEQWHQIDNMGLNKLSEAEQQEFEKDAIKLCSTNADLKPWNLKKMKEIGNPIGKTHLKRTESWFDLLVTNFIVALIASENSPKEAKRTKSTDAGGLHVNTAISKGCRVYLQSNLNSQAGRFPYKIVMYHYHSGLFNLLRFVQWSRWYCLGAGFSTREKSTGIARCGDGTIRQLRW